MSSVTAFAGAVVLVLLAGCHRAPSYPADTPEKALASFGKAIGAGRIPDDLGRLVASELERRTWKLRCRTVGCKKAHFRVVGTRDRSEYKAVLWVDVEVEGRGGDRALAGKHLPVSFERDGNRWMIDRIGDVPVPPPPADAGVPHAPADAATPADAGRHQVDAAP